MFELGLNGHAPKAGSLPNHQEGNAPEAGFAAPPRENKKLKISVL
jgi:hypothetical protein